MHTHTSFLSPHETFIPVWRGLQALEAEAQLRDPPVRGNPFPPVGRPYDQHGQLWNGYPLSRPRGVPIARSDKLPYARPFPPVGRRSGLSFGPLRTGCPFPARREALRLSSVPSSLSPCPAPCFDALRRGRFSAANGFPRPGVFGFFRPPELVQGALLGRCAALWGQPPDGEAPRRTGAGRSAHKAEP